MNSSAFSHKGITLEFPVNKESLLNFSGLCVNKFTVTMSLVVLEKTYVIIARSMDEATVSI